MKKSFYFDNGSDELLQECVLQQGGPVVVEEVDEQTFDVGSVLILEPHEGRLTIAGCCVVIPVIL